MPRIQDLAVGAVNFASPGVSLETTWSSPVKLKELDDNFQELDRWTPREQLPEGHEDLLHINPLEFLAIIINVWLYLYFIRRSPPTEGGHHVLVQQKQ